MELPHSLTLQVPERDVNYHSSLFSDFRSGLRPLVVSQPQGPSFEVRLHPAMQCKVPVCLETIILMHPVNLLHTAVAPGISCNCLDLHEHVPLGAGRHHRSRQSAKVCMHLRLYLSIADGGQSDQVAEVAVPSGVQLQRGRGLAPSRVWPSVIPTGMLHVTVHQPAASWLPRVLACHSGHLQLGCYGICYSQQELSVNCQTICQVSMPNVAQVNMAL